VSVVEERGRSWSLGGVAAVIGLGIGVALIVVRTVGDELKPPAARLEDAVLAVIVLAPLALAVGARAFEPALRAGVWTGAGLLIAFLGLVTLISPIGVVFLTIGILLFVDGVRAPRPRPALGPRFLVSAAVVVAAGVMAPIGSLFLLPASPACWERSTEGEGQAWQRVPLRSELKEGVEELGYGRRGVEGGCSSDTVTSTEAGLAVGTWVAAVAGLVLWNRRRAAA